MDASCGLNLSIRRKGNAVVVFVRGELDFATSPGLVTAIESAAGDDTELCLVDCSEVTFIDSEALKALITIQDRLVDAGIELRIDECSRPVSRTVSLLGLEDRLLAAVSS